MDTTQHYSSLVYHLQPPPAQLPPHPISNPVPRQSLLQDMSWQDPNQSPPNSASATHVQMSSTMSQPQDHNVEEYAPPSAQQSFIPRHVSDSSTTHSSSSVDPGSSSHPMSFDSTQIDGRIGPDRGISRRRMRLTERIPSHEQLPEYGSMSQPYGHPTASQYPSQQSSRPQSPAHSSIYQMSDQNQPPLSNVDPFNKRLEIPSRAEWPMFSQSQSRSASGSAASASSNPRSASPALSVASALTSVSSSASAPNSQVAATFTQPARRAPYVPGRRDKKKRLYNVDRYYICQFAQEHPGMKQEEIAVKFGVERSTVSKILKNRHRWLHVAPDEKILVAKLRPSKFPDLEHRLEEWVKLNSSQGKTLTDSVLRQKARQLGDEMGLTAEKFKASSGWLENFKHRFGIRRGVYHGGGSLDAKYRAYGTDFLPPGPHPVVSYPGTPLPLPGEFSAVDHDMGADSEGEESQSGSLSTDVPAMHPSLALQSTWPQAEAQSTMHGVSSTADSYYESYPPASAPAADAESSLAVEGLSVIPVPLEGQEGGDEQYIGQMPEMVPQLQIPDAREAEHCLDKLLLYINQHKNDLDFNSEQYHLLMQMKYKLFGLATSHTYNSQPFRSRPEQSAS